MKLVHLVGFITKKFVTLHGHMNVIKNNFLRPYRPKDFVCKIDTSALDKGSVKPSWTRVQREGNRYCEQYLYKKRQLVRLFIIRRTAH